MIQFIIGSLILSLIHAAIPNHWIPLVAIAKAENWSRAVTLWITVITGSVHTLSTILIGVVIGIIGYKLSSMHEFITRIVAPSILVLIGLVYVVLDLKSSHHHHHHFEVSKISKKSKVAIVVTLCIAMFFSPCLEIEVYFFHAGTGGWLSIALVSMIYLIVTVIGMVVLVFLGSKGVEKIRWHFLKHHEKMVMGIVLILLGIAAYFIKI